MTKSPKVVILTNEVPNHDQSTITYMTRLILDAVRKGGFQIQSLVVLRENNDPAKDHARNAQVRMLSDEGFPVEILRVGPEDRKAPSWESFNSIRLRRKVFLRRYWFMLFQQTAHPPVEVYFPDVAYASRIREKIASFDPDLVISFAGVGTTYASSFLRIPVFTIFSDPEHLPELYRQLPPLQTWRYVFSGQFCRALWRLWQKRRVLLRLMREIPKPHFTAAHDAAWLQRCGIPDARYIRNLVPDWGGREWRRKRDAFPLGRRLKIMLMGHVTGTATKAGLYCLANILPELERRLGDGFEVHICGKGEIPADLLPRLSHPSVHIRGFVNDIVSELRNSDIFLVPTPIPLGIRVRITYAWSMGCCVVTHSANALGLAELRNGENAMTGGSASKLAAVMAQLAASPELRRKIEDGGRRTFESDYAPEVRIPEFLREIEEFRMSA